MFTWHQKQEKQNAEYGRLTPQKNTCRSMLIGQDRVDTFLTKIIATNLQL